LLPADRRTAKEGLLDCYLLKEEQSSKEGLLEYYLLKEEQLKKDCWIATC